MLDWVGRADVFAALHGPLVEGYALDAIEHVTDERAARAAVDRDVADAFIASVLGAPRRRRPAVGLGEDVRFASTRRVRAPRWTSTASSSRSPRSRASRRRRR